MKVDLFKAYDYVDWSYIRLVLLKIGILIPNIRWIMACTTSVKYDVIINGMPSEFFAAKRGLHQGCALSPLLFIIVMDGYSNLMKMAMQAGYFKGISFSPTVHISHSLFVDDLLVFGRINRNQSFYLHYLFNRFGARTGLTINKHKSILIHADGDEEEISFNVEFLGV